MKKLLFTLGLGAGAMYFLDPELGEIRRSILMDKLSGKLPKTIDAIEAKAEAVHAKVGDVAAKADEAVADAVEHVGAKADDIVEKADDLGEKADDALAEKIDKA